MDKLFRWTIYLIIVFVIAVAIYIYSWLSFKPAEKKEIAIIYRTTYDANVSNYYQGFSSFHLFS